MTAKEQSKEFLKKVEGCCGIWLLPEQWKTVLLALHFAAEEDLSSIIRQQIDSIYHDNMPNPTRCD